MFKIKYDLTAVNRQCKYVNMNVILKVLEYLSSGW